MCVVIKITLPYLRNVLYFCIYKCSWNTVALQDLGIWTQTNNNMLSAGTLRRTHQKVKEIVGYYCWRACVVWGYQAYCYSEKRLFFPLTLLTPQFFQLFLKHSFNSATIYWVDDPVPVTKPNSKDSFIWNSSLQGVWCLQSRSQLYRQRLCIFCALCLGSFLWVFHMAGSLSFKIWF